MVSLMGNYRTIHRWIRRNALWIAFAVVLSVIFLSIRDMPCSAHLRSMDIHKEKVRTENTVHVDHLVQSSGANNLHIIKSPVWGRFITDGMINDQPTAKPIEFMIDTGADQLVIPMSLARHLQLPLGKKIFAQTANGISKGRECFIRSMTLGPFVVSNIMATCKAGLDEGWDQTYVVLVGMDVLKHFHMLIDGDLAIITLPDDGLQ